MFCEPIKIQATVDGACSGNPGPGGVGYVLQCNGHCKEFSRWIGPDTTNNRAELTAIRDALLQINASKRSFCQVTIISDSLYAVQAASGRNKRLKNSDLLDEIDVMVSLFGSVNFVYAPKDSTPELRKADTLARSAIKNKPQVVLP